ncbi:hypothetical protein SDC9_135302 [bioreactor metagenome]|uniref:Flp pilus assembly protein RcpC/CpaB domain-containing protein n=1 Tax=bioreactor metagenome TaxID=1076179 RepID=A0A645DG31_9ZZZZ
MMFYEGMLIDEETYQTYPEFKLQADQLAYMVTGSQVSKLRGSLVTDRYLDLYVTLQLPKQTAVIDCLLRQVRIIGIKDQKGLNITETKSTGIPYVVILAVDEAYLNYLKKAEAMGSVELHLTRKQGHEECVLASDSTVLPYLQ